MNEVASAAVEANTLSRALRPRHLTMIAIGGIIGAGLFVGSSAAIAAAGPAILVTYAVTGFLVLLVMRMLGEMAVGMPHVRSFTEFARLGLGDWAGFSVGWLYWFFWVVVVPVEAIAGAVIIEGWIAMPTWEIGVILMAIMTAVNLLSARAYGEFEFWFSSIKVSSIIAFILVAVVIFFTVFTGIRQVDKKLVERIVTLGGSRIDLLRQVYLPSVAAWVLGNLKVAVGFAFTGAVVGEFVAASRGLGYLLSFAQSTYNAALMLALVLLIMAVVLLIFALAGRLEKRLLRWS